MDISQRILRLENNPSDVVDNIQKCLWCCYINPMLNNVFVVVVVNVNPGWGLWRIQSKWVNTTIQKLSTTGINRWSFVVCAVGTKCEEVVMMRIRKVCVQCPTWEDATDTNWGRKRGLWCDLCCLAMRERREVMSAGRNEQPLAAPVNHPPATRSPPCGNCPESSHPRRRLEQTYILHAFRNIRTRKFETEARMF